MEFYRYTDSHDGFGIHVNLSIYVLLRETPKGYWIVPKYCAYEKFKRFILKRSKKRFAYPTKKEALQNFKLRKQSQIWWGNHHLERATAALSRAEYMERNETL